MSAILPGGKLSPRVDNGIIYFVEGDTFELTFELDISDADGVPIILDGGTFHFTIKSPREGVVKVWDIDEFTQPEEGGLENAVFFAIQFDDATVSKLYKGKYTYTISYDYTLVYDPEDDTENRSGRSTILYRNSLIVE